MFFSNYSSSFLSSLIHDLWLRSLRSAEALARTSPFLISKIETGVSSPSFDSSFPTKVWLDSLIADTVWNLWSISIEGWGSSRKDAVCFSSEASVELVFLGDLTQDFAFLWSDEHRLDSRPDFSIRVLIFWGLPVDINSSKTTLGIECG